ncbi:right-handed parallel beta-helix repeat-containing protein [Arthrobacter sp. NPDC080073]|uniref:right-handed parallel beta-helix repeat-containing protein n=1 Tax=Arthrobacter sp. NPDC080073 TaxID=3155919 RepID=UPI003436207F
MKTSSRKFRLNRTLPTILAASLAATLSATAASAAPDPQAQGSTAYYVDCSRGDDAASGTDPGHPWRTLAHVSAQGFAAGAEIRLLAGTTCTGTLTIHNSHVTVRSYGENAKARIDGAGASDAIVVSNAEDVELHDLDVVNTGPTKSQRRGIWVRLTDFGTGHHYVISNVDVHDVNGLDDKSAQGSAGILFSSLGTATPTRFDDVQVLDNTVTHVDRTGISFSSSWNKRPEQGDQITTWNPNTGVRVVGNHVKDTGGDGIVLRVSTGALVARNTVDGYNMRSAAYNAGIWSWNADHVTYEYNDVSHGHGVLDSMAYDIDGANNGNVYQYNYSHDNEGGFLLICTSPGVKSADNIARYNVSINDRNTWTPYYGIITIGCGAPTTNTQVYGNSIVSNQGGTTLVNDLRGLGGVTFRNNIFAATVAGGLPVRDSSNTYDHNLFFGATTLPAHNSNAVTGDPGFMNADPKTPKDIRLRHDSPAAGAGTPISNDVTTDYFGKAIPASPSLGADTRAPGSSKLD